MQNVRLKNGAFKHIESELRHYHETLREIALLREEILYGQAEQDDNIGGGKSNLPGNPTERKAIALVSNRRLENLERVVQVINYVYGALPDEKKKLVQLKYWDRPQTLTWDGIALKLNVSRITAVRWRSEIVQDIAVLLGWG